MRGQIIKRGHLKYQIRADRGRDVNGKRHTVSTTVYGTLQQARIQLALLLEQADETRVAPYTKVGRRHSQPIKCCICLQRDARVCNLYCGIACIKSHIQTLTTLVSNLESEKQCKAITRKLLRQIKAAARQGKSQQEASEHPEI